MAERAGRNLQVVEISLLVLLGLVWLGAKVHFFQRFFVLDTGAYLGEHWVYWAVMLAIGALLWTVSALADRPPSELTDSKGSRT